MTDKELLQAAAAVQSNAYAPYSGFKVGAAILAEDGGLYTGANVENKSYGATNCAERTAIFKAVSEGNRKITAIAIISDSETPVFPCGICRQVISEFADKNMKIICGSKNGEYVTYTLDELLPNRF